MIGQERLKLYLKEQVENGTFPRFSIIVGTKGSGKKEIVKYIASLIPEITLYQSGNTVSEVRQVIIESYKSCVPVLYQFADVDGMSNEAKNALLKVTEEPPKKAYFIMTLEDTGNMLETIKSRATMYFMDRYTKENILQYAQECNIAGSTDIITSLCTNMGEVMSLSVIGVDEFYKYVAKVIDNIALVSTANALKIAETIAFTDEDKGYDLVLFWRAVERVYMNMMLKCEDTQYQNIIAQCIALTQQGLVSCRIKGINKKMLFDKWILDVREVEDGYNYSETTNPD